MDHLTYPRRSLATPKGPVDLILPAGPDLVRQCVMDEGIGEFEDWQSIITGREQLVDMSGQPDTKLCLAITPDNKIVSYCVQKPPESGDRWENMQPPVLREIFCETSRHWRGLGIIRKMLEFLLDDPAKDDFILYIVGFSWHWDLEHNGQTLQEYRQALISLLLPLGFKEMPTNEPNISLRPENLFMARLGANLDRPIKRRFSNLLFGIRED